MAERRERGIAAPGERADAFTFVPDLNTPRRFEKLASLLSKRGHSTLRSRRSWAGISIGSSAKSGAEANCNLMLKHLLLGILCPGLMCAQNMQLTEQLRKTVFYDDIAMSPDGEHAAWAQSTVALQGPATLSGEEMERAIVAANSSGEKAERVDSDPAWAPDSKTIAFFSTVGEKDPAPALDAPVRWLEPAEDTALQGYAARPHWSPDGKADRLPLHRRRRRRRSTGRRTWDDRRGRYRDS